VNLIVGTECRKTGNPRAICTATAADIDFCYLTRGLLLLPTFLFDASAGTARMEPRDPEEEARRSRRSSSSKARQQMLGDATTCLAY